MLSAGVTVGVAVDLDARKIFFATDGRWDEVPAFSEEDRSFHHQNPSNMEDYHGLSWIMEVYRGFQTLFTVGGAAVSPCRKSEGSGIKDIPLGLALYPAVSLKGRASFCFGNLAEILHADDH